ncbi:MAG: hypothetical protein ABIT38_02650 [Gemmatimonadaceae bacterium]
MSITLDRAELFRSPTRTGSKYFQVWMAGLCVLVSFAGFAPTYWGRLASGTDVGPPILHLHGLLFSAWPIFLLVQAALAASGRMARHRAVGLVGIALATSMVLVGTLLALVRVKHLIAMGQGDAAIAFSIVPLLGPPVFAATFIAAIAAVRRPETHQRLMLVATVGLLQAATGRFFRLVLLPPELRTIPLMDAPAPPVAVTVGPALAAFLIILIGMLYDWRTRGRPHPAYVIGGGITLAVQLLKVPLSTTAAWRATVHGLLSLMA